MTARGQDPLMRRQTTETAAAELRRISSLRPTLGIVLGSGFNGLLGEIEPQARLGYSELPGFPPVGIEGHPGEVVVGRWAGEPVIVLAGRAHFYEGHPLSAVTLPVRVLAAYGVRDLLLTNAAGGIAPKLRVGDLMLVNDHINFMGTNPLRGSAPTRLPRFVDLSEAYDPGLRQLLRRAGRACDVLLKTGVYLAVCGPCFETPAEIRAFRRLGADAVGMSTVPEAIVARQHGLRVAAISCITNLAAGRGRAPISHQEVLDTGARVQADARRLIGQFMKLYHERRAGTEAKIRIEKARPPRKLKLESGSDEV